MMFELLLPKATEGVEADDVKIALVPVSADKAAADDRYSNEMCPQPVELIFDMSEIFDPKRKRRRVKKRPPVARRVLPAMSRPREHRAVPRRGGASGREDSGDDGGGDGPPPRRKSDYGPRAEAIPQSQSSTRAPRVSNHGRAQP